MIPNIKDSEGKFINSPQGINEIFRDFDAEQYSSENNQDRMSSTHFLIRLNSLNLTKSKLTN